MRVWGIAVLAILAPAASAWGAVTASSDLGFVVDRSVVVPANAATSWRMLLQPAAWWQGVHTFSGNAANLTMDVRAGGCFCERLPGRGHVQHMRVIHAAPGRLLRMSGALGPLQGEAVQGTMTITLEPATAGTAIRMVYVVGGYMRLKTAQIAPAVDAVLGAQLASLAERLGVARPASAPVPSAP